VTANSFAEQLAVLQESLAAIPLGSLQSSLDAAVDKLAHALSDGKPVLVCGNGGSAADAQHIAGELVGKFLKVRRALNVRALSTDTSVLTAWANDVAYDTVFERQVEAYGQPGGVLWAISTSGNSRNVVAAAAKATTLGMSVLAMTGEGGGRLGGLADIRLAVPSMLTPRIQEMHIMLYHYICERVEAHFA
jgi:D-sedoheptulose 7-phosphate isomerase